MSNLLALGIVILAASALLAAAWGAGYALHYLLTRKDTP